MWIELSEDLSALKNPERTASDFQLLGHPLNSAASPLPLQGLTSATCQPPPGAEKQSFRGGKSFYAIGGIEYEHSLADQLASVLRFGGWLRYGEYGLRVYEGHIKEFGIGSLEQILDSVTSREEVIRQFGVPQYAVELWDTGELMSTTFGYQRGIRLFLDDHRHVRG